MNRGASGLWPEWSAPFCLDCHLLCLPAGLQLPQPSCTKLTTSICYNHPATENWLHQSATTTQLQKTDYINLLQPPSYRKLTTSICYNHPATQNWLHQSATTTQLHKTDYINLLQPPSYTKLTTSVWICLHEHTVFWNLTYPMKKGCWYLTALILRLMKVYFLTKHMVPCEHENTPCWTIVGAYSLFIYHKLITFDSSSELASWVQSFPLSSKVNAFNASACTTDHFLDIFLRFHAHRKLKQGQHAHVRFIKQEQPLSQPKGKMTLREREFCTLTCLLLSYK